MALMFGYVLVRNGAEDYGEERFYRSCLSLETY
jgi:hypothetical protein